MLYTLPPLPYSFDALEPHIDAKTMEIHHGKHHAGYVANLNKAIEGQELGDLTVEELLAVVHTLPEAIRTVVRNNGGGHANHSLFWEIMSPKGGGLPHGELGKALDEHFGNLDHFKEAITKAALGRFGSGWAWLSLTHDKRLIVEDTPNQDNPWMNGTTPLVGIDVWEHAYYLKYQNRRADYLAAFWNVVNWEAVAERYHEAMKHEAAMV